MKKLVITIAVLVVVIIALLVAVVGIVVHYEIGSGCTQQFGYQCQVVGRQFESAEELKVWLREDLTSRQPFVWVEHDCDDYAVDLIRAAQEDGYQMGLLIVDYEGYYACHLKNFTVIGNAVYLIEPQNDSVELWAYQHFGFEDDWSYFQK